MTNVWKLPTTASAANPPLFSAGEPPPANPPPDPPDPASPLSLHDYPLLSSSSKTVSSSHSKKKGSLIPQTLPTGAIPKHLLTAPSSIGLLLVPESLKTGSHDSTTSVSRSEAQNSTVQEPLLPVQENLIQNITTINPTSSSPVHTNKASSSLKTTTASHPANKTPSIPTTEKSLPIPLASASNPTPPLTAPPALSLVERLRLAEDKTLKRLAPVTLSESGRPRILIPDSVFAKGAEIHKDFIICYYNGKAPPFNQI
ncbi:hypothetical protein BRARA_B02927 [Brassica rapa]|uniref:Uncharacterized protein n=1 Tax=Brassica campestris TaxID=3711 RepID=A0A398AKP1_BRACM|nr:hypothetical protein BRARA_B02927 [Brassica rapa]